MRQERSSPVAHKSSCLIRLLCHVNVKDSPGLAVDLARRIDQLINGLVYLPMLEGDQASDRKRTKEVRGSLGLLDPVYHAQQHSGQRK